MDDISKMESGFRINNLLLIESTFRRINNVQFGDDVKSDLNINTEVGVKDNKIITVTETISINQKYKEIKQVFVSVKMVGIFECIGATQLNNLEEFGKVNGAAIILPYIREHITNISLKAGIGPIIVPPVNFSKNKDK